MGTFQGLIKTKEAKELNELLIKLVLKQVS